MSRNASRTQRFIQNSLATAAYQIVAMIMGFLTPRVMIAFYGDSINGVIGTVNDNILYYFKNVHVGIASAAIAALFTPLVLHDRQKVSGIVSAARRLYNIAGFIFIGVTVIVAVVYTSTVHVTDLAGNPENSLTVFLLILTLGISAILEFFTFAKNRVLLMADQRTYMVSLAQMVSLILQTAVLMFLPQLGLGVIPVRLIAALTVLARILVLSRYVKKHYSWVDWSTKPDTAALSGHWDALLSEMTTVFQSSAGAILGTFIVRDAATMSIYIVYHLVITGLWSVLRMVTEGVSSIFGNLRVSDSQEHFQHAFRDFECLFHSICSVLFGVAAVLIVPFAKLYAQGQTTLNYAVPVLGAAVILDAVTFHMNMPFDVMIQSTGRFRDVRNHCLLEMLITVIGGVVLGLWGLSVSPMMALCGVMLGVAFGNISRLVMHLRLVPKKITCLPVKDSIFRILRMLLNVLLIVLPYELLNLPVENFLQWLIHAGVMTIYAVFVTVLLSLLLDRKATISLLDRFRNLLKSRTGKGEVI